MSEVNAPAATVARVSRAKSSCQSWRGGVLRRSKLGMARSTMARRWGLARLADVGEGVDDDIVEQGDDGRNERG